MDKVPSLYADRNSRSMDLIKRAFDFEEPKEVPFIFNTSNYFSFGYPPEELPEDYYITPASMYERQVRQFENHFNVIDDHYVPYLMPWYGTGVTASGFGIGVNFLPKMDPTTEIPIMKNPEEIDRMKMPDFSKDGLMPKVLDTIRYFQKNSEIPIGFTDNHGPLTLAVQVVGYENLFYWMYDYPKQIHKLMDLLSDTLIAWVTHQKELIGEPLNHCFGNQGIYVPEGVGVWFSDDDCVILPESLYREFVVPYNEKILKHFGGGILHFCGTANQHIENFKRMKHLRGINNFALGSWRSLLALKKGLEGRVAIIACDFTHLDFRGYYRKLFEENGMSKRGLVVQSLFSPVIGADDGKYHLVKRSEKRVADEIKEEEKKYFNLN